MVAVEWQSAHCSWLRRCLWLLACVEHSYLSSDEEDALAAAASSAAGAEPLVDLEDMGDVMQATARRAKEEAAREAAGKVRCETAATR